MNKKLQAHSAIFFANTIFGLGVPVTKLLLDEWVTPMGYMATRSLGACILFWVIAAFFPKEKVERKDLITILFGGLLGFVISQTLTAWALDYTSPVYFSLIATLTPVAVMLCAAGSITWYCRCCLDGADEPIARFGKERPDRYLARHPECAHVGCLPDNHP